MSLTFHGWPWLPAGLLVLCLASFGWAMRNFFSQPAGKTTGMKVIGACGSAFAVVHLATIVLAPRVTAFPNLAAALLYILALCLFWWAIQTNSKRPFSAAFSPDAPVHLMDRGPYRFIRHPFYCSYLLTWIAGFVATGRLWLLPSIAIMLAIYVRAALMEEEKFTRSPLARAYQQYRARTGAFLPNPVKLFSAAEWDRRS